MNVNFFWFAVVLLIVIGAVVHANGFKGVFLFDDTGMILENRRLQSFEWPWAFIGNTRRPFLFLTLAVNYAIAQHQAWSYHLFNLFFHLMAGLYLFGIARRTLELPVWENRFQGQSLFLSFLIACLWVVHPLQTESVTYIIQRAESLAGLFYLGAFYCAIRFMRAPQQWWWAACAGWVSLLGGLTKETIATLPLVVLLYDRAFISGSLWKSLKNHRALYFRLVLTWVVITALFFGTKPEMFPTAGFRAGIAPLDYFLTQFMVVPHYLRLVFWPYPLILSYDWPLILDLTRVLPAAVVMSLLFVSALWAYSTRWRGAGFLGLTFFVLLAPSSSFIPLNDPAFEHRMYLPLACVVALAVLAARALLSRVCVNKIFCGAGAILLSAGAIGVMGYMTHQRNKDYYSEEAMWSQTVRYRPENFRALTDLGLAYKNKGDLSRAEDLYRKALELNPAYVTAYLNLGNIYAQQGNFNEAGIYYARTVELDPFNAKGYANLGMLAVNSGRLDEAAQDFERAIDLGFDEPEVFHNLGILQAQNGNVEKAVENFKRASALDPANAEAFANLGMAYFDQKWYAESAQALKKALGLGLADAGIYHTLAISLAGSGNVTEAAFFIQKAADLDPKSEAIQKDFNEIRSLLPRIRQP